MLAACVRHAERRAMVPLGSQCWGRCSTDGSTTRAFILYKLLSSRAALSNVNVMNFSYFRVERSELYYNSRLSLNPYPSVTDLNYGF